MALRDLFRSTPTPSTPNGVGLTAAAKVIDVRDEDEAARVRKGPRQWQQAAWAAVDDVAEIGYAANYQAGALGRVRLVPAMQPDPRDDPVPLDPEGDDDLDIDDEERAACFATINRLGSGPLPLSEIQRLIALNLFTCGDGTLVGYDDAGVETWDVLSVDELVPSDSGRGYARRTQPEGGAGSKEPLPEDAFLARLYQRHPRYSKWAYSSMLTVLPLCDELRLLTDAIHAETQSRIPAGILLLSHGFRAKPGVDPNVTGEEAEKDLDPNVRLYMEHLETPIKDRRSASALTPFVWFADRDDVQNGSKLIEFSRAVDAVQAAQREELIRRIATGIDLPAEVLSGKADLNHWTAWQVGEETFRYHLEPDTQVMVQALTSGYFRPHLDAMGVEGTQRFLVWYDASPLTEKPDKSEHYAAAHERYAVSDDAYRRALNIPDDDKPDDDEVAERLWRDLMGRISVSTEQMPTPEDIERHEIAPPPEDDPFGGGPPGSNGGGPSPPVVEGPPPSGPPVEVGAAVSAGGDVAVATVPRLGLLAAASPYGGLGARLHAIERQLRNRLLQASDDATRRALERAGARLLNLANKRVDPAEKKRLRGVDVLEIGRHLGRERVAALGVSADDLLVGAFANLDSSFERWVGHRQEQALQAIIDAGELTEAEAAYFRQQMADAREEGKAVLLAGLLASASALLYDPTVHAPAHGEFSDYTVKPRLVRQALVAAGGGKDALGLSVGMVTGALFAALLVRAGLRKTGYTWVHGDPMTPLEEHEALDGEPISGPNDPKLQGPPAWTDFDYLWPDDHEGCTCDVIENIEPEPEAG